MSEQGATASFEVIDREECLRLVGTLSIGRLAVSIAGDAPLVVPINFVLDGDAVVFRTDPGSKLHALNGDPLDAAQISTHANASFQVDLIDPLHHTGWSVLIRGLAYETARPQAADQLIESWAPGDKDHWVRLVPSAISGRRISVPELAWDTRGYM